MPKKTDAALASELQRKGHLAFNWNDLDKIELPSGIVTSMYRVGDSTDAAAPTVFKVFYPPNCYTEAHTHACDYTEIILDRPRGRHRLVYVQGWPMACYYIGQQ